MQIDDSLSALTHWKFKWSPETCIFDEFDVDQVAGKAEQTRHPKYLDENHMTLLNTERLEAILGSMDLFNLDYACLFSCPPMAVKAPTRSFTWTGQRKTTSITCDTRPVSPLAR